MRRLRFIAGAAAPLLAVGLLSACDASPYAANVGNSTIKSTALNTELRWSAAASNYTTALSGNYSQLFNVQLAVAGTTANSYSSQWSAYTLSAMIQGDVVRRAVEASGQEPSSDLYTAALGGVEIENGGVTGPSHNGGITQMAPAYQVDVTQRLADHAQLEKGLPVAQLQSLYGNYLPNFYAQVCVRQASVSVGGPGGSVNYPASAAQAATVARQMTSGSSNVGGAANCYTHEQLDAQPASFINTVVGLAPGHAAIGRTGYGYQVTLVSSRQTLPLAGSVAQVLTTLVYDLQQPGSDIVLRGLLARAKVRVNPAYGSWSAGGTNTLASVVAPSAPAAAPVGSSAVVGAGSLGGSLGS